MATNVFASANFTGTNGVNISTLGFTKLGAGTDILIDSNHAYCATASADWSMYYLGAVAPPTADYDVSCIVFTNNTDSIGPAGRVSADGTEGLYVKYIAGGGWWLGERKASVNTQLDVQVGPNPSGVAVSVILRMRGNKASVLAGPLGAETQVIAPVTTTVIAAGFPGTGSYFSGSNTGNYIDDLTASTTAIPTIVPNSPIHVRPLTSGTPFTMGAAAAIGDVVVVFTGSFNSSTASTATVSCTGATVVLSSRVRQLANDGATVVTCFTGKVTGAGTPVITVTDTGTTILADALILTSADSDTPNSITSALFTSDASVYAVPITTTNITSIFNYWVNISTDPYVSWLSSASVINRDAVAASGLAYLAEQLAGTYNMGINSNNTGSFRHAGISLAISSNLRTSSGALVGPVSTIAGSADVPTLPQFTVQPTVQIASEGSLATFTGTATNAVSYQWYVDIGQGSGPQTVSGATSTTLITPFLFRSIHAGWIYTLRATNTIGTNISNAALLQVTNIPINFSNGGFTVGDSFVGDGQIGAAAVEVHTAGGPLIGQGSAIVGSASRSTAGGVVTHTSTAVLTGQIGSIVGTATRFRVFTTSGNLVGQSAAIVGSAARFRAFSTSGTLTGPGSTIAGSAARFRAFSTSGALIGQGSIVSGSATRFRVFTTSGNLVGQSAAIVGSVARFRAFSTSGTLTGSGSTIAGSTVRFRAFSTSGALIGQGSIISGSATRYRAFGTSGVITGPGAVLTSSAVHNALHTTTGVLAGSGALISGTATRFRVFTSSGTIVGQGSTIVGSASRSNGPVSHGTTGTLTGQSSTVVGSAARFRAMATSGILTGQGSVLTGSAVYNAKHLTSGVLTGQGTTIVGEAARFRAMTTSGVLSGAGALVSGSAIRSNGPLSHATTGTLTGPGAQISGTAFVSHLHVTSGVLVGPGSIVSGAATRFRAFATSGTLVGQNSTVTGNANRFRSFASSGNLVGAGSLISGSAFHSVLHATTAALTGQGSSVSGSATRFRVFSSSGSLNGAGAILSGIALHPLAITDYTGEIFIRDDVVSYYYQSALVDSYATSDKIEYHYVVSDLPLITTKDDPQYYYRTEDISIFVTD